MKVTIDTLFQLNNKITDIHYKNVEDKINGKYIENDLFKEITEELNSLISLYEPIQSIIDEVIKVKLSKSLVESINSYIIFYSKDE